MVQTLVNEAVTEAVVWSLTPEGRLTLQEGSMEACVYNAVPEGGIAQADLVVRLLF